MSTRRLRFCGKLKVGVYGFVTHRLRFYVTTRMGTSYVTRRVRFSTNVNLPTPITRRIRFKTQAVISHVTADTWSELFNDVSQSFIADGKGSILNEHLKFVEITNSGITIAPGFLYNDYNEYFIYGDNLNIYPIGNFFVVLYVVFISYAILKHHLFDVRVITAEIFALAICVVLLAKLLLSNGFYDYLINCGMLAVAAVFGLLLVRSVIHEVEQKNKIEAMSVDVKKAYEVEKKAKEELERLDEAKSQFMMATQHHLRTPLTALKGYLSLTLEGDFG